MSAIYKRELRAFFSSPIGYIFVAVFFAVNGALFNYMVLRSSDSGGIGTYSVFIHHYRPASDHEAVQR